METRKKYGELFTKPTPWTEIEQQNVLEFENFIKNSKEYRDYTNEQNKRIVSDYDHEIAFLESLSDEQKNDNIKRTIAVGKNMQQIISIEDEYLKQQFIAQEKEKALELKLQKRAGYTNASILIFIICNLGFFLAFMLLMLQ